MVAENHRLGEFRPSATHKSLVPRSKWLNNKDIQAIAWSRFGILRALLDCGTFHEVAHESEQSSLAGNPDSGAFGRNSGRGPSAARSRADPGAWFWRSRE